MMLEAYKQYMIALCIGLVSVQGAAAETCPYIHTNCNCFDEEVVCSNLQQIPPLKTGAGVARVSVLTFRGGNITRIAGNSLPPGLGTITLSSLPLTGISDDAFDNSNATLLYLYITGAQFKTLPKALAKVHNLMALHLVDTPVHDWDDATILQLGTSVRTLNLRNVTLPAWPSWLSYFKSLVSLTLDTNSLTSIPDDAFDSLHDTLTELRLKNTNLTKLPEALSNASSLQTLDLGSNRFAVSELERLPQFLFATELLSLYLDSIGITNLTDLSNMTSVKVLSLANNRIADVPLGSCPPSLSILILSGNNLSSVPSDIVSLLDLSHVNLAYNQISELEPDTFPPSIEEIDLTFNKLTAINNTAFLKLDLLRSLALNNNPLSMISPSAFSGLMSLTYLNLTGSRLVELPAAFASLTNDHVNIDISTMESIACPCPGARELFEWFTSGVVRSLTCISCRSGQSVCSYLRDQCGILTPTPRREQNSTMSSSFSSSSSTSIPLLSSTSFNSSPSVIHSSASYYYLITIIIINAFIQHHHQTVPCTR